MVIAPFYVYNNIKYGENESDEEEVIGTRYELRKRYWTYALDNIKRMHEGSGSFINVNPSKDNWVNGYMGISGFHISCIANYDGARVELVLGKASKEKNKAAYDHLIKHKNEIEEVLNIALVWARGDDIKSSKVYCQIENVSINNETDWTQMSKFHAEWSKNLYDVFVPLLNELQM